MLNSSRLLFQLLDVIAGDFPNTAGQRTKFQALLADDKLKVFELSKGVPTLGGEQIRNYQMFATYMQITILEQSRSPAATIKEFIKQLCQINLPAKSFETISVAELFKVCLVSFRSIN